VDLGERIRERRQAMGLSLRDLAAQAGVTASFLSQVERGATSPSIDSLRRISAALNVPVFHFLVEPEVESPLVRREQRIRLTMPGSQVAFQLLSPKLNRKMGAFLTEREPGDQTPIVRFGQQTEEFIYVLQGQLEVRLGDEAFLLMPDDAIYFDGAMLRGLTPLGTETVRFISVITPPAF
jgi:transcriptional regulator with XRE-family HTH domain